MSKRARDAARNARGGASAAGPAAAQGVAQGAGTARRLKRCNSFLEDWAASGGESTRERSGRHFERRSSAERHEREQAAARREAERKSEARAFTALSFAERLKASSRRSRGGGGAMPSAAQLPNAATTQPRPSEVRI